MFRDIEYGELKIISNDIVSALENKTSLPCDSRPLIEWYQGEINELDESIESHSALVTDIMKAVNIEVRNIAQVLKKEYNISYYADANLVTENIEDFIKLVNVFTFYKNDLFRGILKVLVDNNFSFDLHIEELFDTTDNEGVIVKLIEHTHDVTMVLDKLSKQDKFNILNDNSISPISDELLMEWVSWMTWNGILLHPTYTSILIDGYLNEKRREAKFGGVRR